MNDLRRVAVEHRLQRSRLPRGTAACFVASRTSPAAGRLSSRAAHRADARLRRCCGALESPPAHFSLFLAPRRNVPRSLPPPRAQRAGGATPAYPAPPQPSGAAMRNLREVFGDGPVLGWLLPVRGGQPRGSLAARTIALQKGR